MSQLGSEVMLDTIRRCFRENKVLYTTHARKEMRLEEHGLIREEENEVCYLQQPRYYKKESRGRDPEK